MPWHLTVLACALLMCMALVTTVVSLVVLLVRRGPEAGVLRVDGVLDQAADQPPHHRREEPGQLQDQGVAAAAALFPQQVGADHGESGPGGPPGELATLLEPGHRPHRRRLAGL